MALAAVLIDLDGTLWDSAPWYAELLAPDDDAVQEALASALRDGAGGPRAATLLKHKYSAGSFARATERVGNRLRVYGGAKAVIEELSERFVLGVVTSLPGWMATPMLGANQLIDYFSVIQTAAWRVPAKPNPATLNLALSSIATPACDAVYIGDSLTDAQAASRAGMAFIGAGWGYGSLSGPHAVGDWPAVRGAL